MSLKKVEVRYNRRKNGGRGKEKSTMAMTNWWKKYGEEYTRRWIDRGQGQKKELGRWGGRQGSKNVSGTMLWVRASVEMSGGDVRAATWPS